MPLQLTPSSRAEIARVSSRLYGIPENSKHFMILGRLFKVHPLFDDILFNILQSTATNVYVIVVREKNNVDLNSELHHRWMLKQEEVCCSGGSSELSSCCGRVHSYKDYYHSQHIKQMNNMGSEAKHGPNEGLFTDSRYVLHRIRFVHYDFYVHALMAATAVLDTFP